MAPLWRSLRVSLASAMLILALPLATAAEPVTHSSPNPCSAVPGSAPQVPLQLLRAGALRNSVVLRIAAPGVNGASLQHRLRRIFLVPAMGEAIFRTVNAANATTLRVESQNGRPVSSIDITLPRPPFGDYRVLVEDTDLSAPPGCYIPFFIVLGTVNVGPGDKP